MAGNQERDNAPGAGGAAFGETKDFRIALLGNVDSGKSTLCGVLSRGKEELMRHL